MSLQNMNREVTFNTTEAIDHFVRRSMASEDGSLGSRLFEMQEVFEEYIGDQQKATTYLEDEGCIPVEGGEWIIPGVNEVMLWTESIPPFVPELPEADNQIK